MVIFGIILVCNLSTGQFCVVDSVLYAIDPADFTLHRQALPSSVIDVYADASAYVLTDRFLYRVEYPNLTVLDRILLPQRFNHIIADENDIILIGTNEVILVDKKNLTFKSGIGIEQGDYQPLAVTTRRGIPAQKNIFLMVNSGTRSTVKVFDLDKGTLVKKMNRDQILFTNFDAHSNTISTLDTKNAIIVYDTDLHTLLRMTVPPDPLFFAPHESGYVVYCRNGIFLVNRAGRIIDFQPIPLAGHPIGQRSMYLVENGIAAFDLFTIRPKAFSRTGRAFTRIYDLNDTGERFCLLLDEDSSPFLFDAETMDIHEVSKIPIAQAPPSMPRTIHKDSLWYFQLGAFIQHTNAFDAYAAMKSKNLPVFIDSTDLYRIKLGGFHDKETAMNALEMTDLTGWFILQERTDQKGTATFFLGDQPFTLKDGIIERSSP